MRKGYNERAAIRRRMAGTTIYWMRIDDLPKFLEDKYHDGFALMDVIAFARTSPSVSKAWSPGGHHLMISNRAKVTDFVNVEAA
jgi:hypothetical protein